MSLSGIGAELATVLLDAGETFILSDGFEFTGVWLHVTSEEAGVRGGETTVRALSTDTACVSMGDSIYRQSDEPPVEYKVRDRSEDDSGWLETLTLERQDA